MVPAIYFYEHWNPYEGEPVDEEFIPINEEAFLNGNESQGCSINKFIRSFIHILHMLYDNSIDEEHYDIMVEALINHLPDKFGK